MVAPDGSQKGLILPSVCPDVFLELDHYLILNFGMVLETHMKLCITVADFWKKKLALLKMEKMDQK